MGVFSFARSWGGGGEGGAGREGGWRVRIERGAKVIFDLQVIWLANHNFQYTQ